jgi:precorrin-6B methylase 2
VNTPATATATATAAPVTPDSILQLGLAFWGSKTFLSAVELGLFTFLATGPKTHAQIAGRLELHPRSSRDFLDALVALGMLSRTGDDLYANTPQTDLFLDKNKPTYVGGMLEMANARLYPFWNHLTEALRTGELQNEAKGGGKGLFEAVYADPNNLRQFLGAMTGLSLAAGQAIAGKFPWQNYKSFIDIGCAQGAVPVQVALAHPHLAGGGFDLPEVGPVFKDYITSFNLSARVTFHPGSFMTGPLPQADVLIMGHILHDWDLAEKRMLLKKAYDALPPGGALIAYDAMIDNERRSNAFGLLMSLNMLIETPGGFDYTPADCQGWMREAGFKQTRVEHLLGPDSMVIGIK